MTETDISTPRTGGVGRRLLSTTHPGMGGEMTRRSSLVEVEEELAKETEEGSHHHPEEMEINLVVIGQHRQGGIIDGDAQGATIVEVLSALAKRFEKLP